jgi:hypothetical protein
MRGLGDNFGRRSAAWVYATIATLLLTGSLPAVAADTWGNARILYFERFQTQIDPRPGLVEKRSTTRVLKFDAYGRDFELVLEPNELLSGAHTTDAATPVRLYRGQLTGIAGSWARIGTQGANVHGLVWDGAQLYVIEPSDAVRDSLVPPLDASNTRTVLFRLSDTILDEGAALCAASNDVAMTGGDSYKTLQRELKALKGDPVLMQATTAGMRLELAAIGDALFRAQFQSDAAAIDQMLLRLNNVDGIFAAELGVRIQVPTALVYDAETDPLPPTTVASDLLRRLATLRGSSTQLKSRGLTHLFTGRDLDGSTVGIGYIDTLCDGEFGAALTEIRGRGAWLESLITAHEIGHNFGAVHDGESECNTVPLDQFLMSPTVHAAHASFSSCSRDRMVDRMLGAGCIVPLPPADLAIASDFGTLHEGVGRSFEWQLPVTNVGGRATQSARIEVLVPSTLGVSDAWIAGGSCTSGAGVIDCELGSIAGGVTRVLNLTMSSPTMNVSEISARIISLTDALTSNNTGTGTISIDPELDLGIALQAPAAIVAGDTFSAAFTISNAALEEARSVSISLTRPSNLAVSAATLPGGSCDLVALVCTLPSFPAGGSLSGSLTLTANAAGSGELSARVSAASFDPNTPNDTAAQMITVSAATTAIASSPATEPASGGGGAFGFGFLLALLGLTSRRLRAAH